MEPSTSPWAIPGKSHCPVEAVYRLNTPVRDVPYFQGTTSLRHFEAPRKDAHHFLNRIMLLLNRAQYARTR